MTVTIIIVFCVLLLIAYLFDLTALKTRVPSVILLLLLGWLLRYLSKFLNIELPDFSSVLPILGTIGLILIVLEGSLELELNISKLGLIRKSFLGALLPMLILASLLAFLFHHFGGFGLKISLINAMPFCVISSAIAIPTARSISKSNREFITYESSFSDIMGVVFFNFLVLNETIDINAFGHFGLQLLIIIVVSFFASILLSFLLNNIDHHVKFVPIILLIVLIFALSEVYHLPALVFIMFFGLLINNLDELKKIKWIEIFRPDKLNKEVVKFKELTTEVAFLVRALFFMLFGYLIETADVLNPKTFLWSLLIVISIFSIRAIQLLISKLPIRPLLFIAPRGLITILLFLSITAAQQIDLVNKSLVIQVVILTALFMMIGMIISKREVQKV